MFVRLRKQSRTGEHRSHQRGFTLIELMVVIAIIGILSAIAIVSIRPSRYAGTSQGFAEKIAAEVEGTRIRAVASGRWQQLEITGALIIHWEATTEGMATPVSYQEVRRFAAPDDVFVRATSPRTHLAADDSPPAVGDDMPAVVNFAPDGSAEAVTIFISDDYDDDFYRVAIFQATGTAYVFKRW